MVGLLRSRGSTADRARRPWFVLARIREAKVVPSAQSGGPQISEIWRSINIRPGVGENYEFYLADPRRLDRLEPIQLERK